MASGSYERPNPTSTRQSTKNPIALRLYKVLGTNYEDGALRESLNSLSQFYDTPNELDAPKQPPNVAFVRKNLERDLQIRLETGAQQFLKAFEIVDQVGPMTVESIRRSLRSSEPNFPRELH
jgi:hypothetical protein